MPTNTRNVVNSNVVMPAYSTTRFSGINNFKKDVDKYFINSPRNAYIGAPPACSKVDKWSIMSSRNKKRIKKEQEEDVCKNSINSEILSVCKDVSEESNRCTCDEVKPDENYCNCLENNQKESESSCGSPTNAEDWKKVYKLTDTSETNLTDSYQRLLNCVSNGGDVNLFFDLYEPHPREARQINEKNTANPNGYNVTLVLPQCVCLKNYQECKKIENEESEETINEEKCETISELICIPSIAELSWDIMQSGMKEKIPEKYMRHVFEKEKDEEKKICTNASCANAGKAVYKNANSGIMRCLHKTFLEKVNGSYFSM